MLRSNKTTQFDGTSYITDGEGNEQTVAYFSATIRTDKTVTMSMTVSNAELYEENKPQSERIIRSSRLPYIPPRTQSKEKL